jgi:hypothetical protein
MHDAFGECLPPAGGIKMKGFYGHKNTSCIPLFKPAIPHCFFLIHLAQTG